jgi:hypothetical protein
MIAAVFKAPAQALQGLQALMEMGIAQRRSDKRPSSDQPGLMQRHMKRGGHV